MVKGLGLFAERDWTLYEWWLKKGDNWEWPKQSTKKGAGGRSGGGEIEPRSVLDVLSGSEEGASFGETTKPRVTDQSEIGMGVGKPSRLFL